MNLEDVGMYAEWCETIMDKIEYIAKLKYPETKVWIDTGSRWNACMAMLEQFRKDIRKCKK